MTHRFVASVGLLSLVISACVPEVKDDLSTITSPRLLAVQSTPAEVAPGEKTAVTALIAAPDGAPIPAVDWALCVDRKPPTELGPVSSRCLSLSRDPGVEQPLGRGATIELPVITQTSCSLFGPDPPPSTPGEPAGRPADPDPTGGYYQPIMAFLVGSGVSLGDVRLDCGGPPVDRATALQYQSRYVRNENPVIDALEIAEGATFVDVPSGDTPTPKVVKRSTRIDLRATWAACPRCPDLCNADADAAACPSDCRKPVPCTGAESYAWVDASTNRLTERREAITVSWYATGGDFDSPQTGVAESDPDQPTIDNGWTAPTAPGNVKVWAVIRDDRGGVSFRFYRLAVMD